LRVVVHIKIGPAPRTGNAREISKNDRTSFTDNRGSDECQIWPRDNSAYLFSRAPATPLVIGGGFFDARARS
jgi:hypothetical protein